MSHWTIDLATGFEDLLIVRTWIYGWWNEALQKRKWSISSEDQFQALLCLLYKTKYKALVLPHTWCDRDLIYFLFCEWWKYCKARFLIFLNLSPPDCSLKLRRHLPIWTFRAQSLAGKESRFSTRYPFSRPSIWLMRCHCTWVFGWIYLVVQELRYIFSTVS